MNWEALSAIGELIGALAVLLLLTNHYAITSVDFPMTARSRIYENDSQ